MKKSSFLLAMLALALGLAFVGCDTGGDVDTTSKLDGTWIQNPHQLIISGKDVTIKKEGLNFFRGTMTFTDTKITLTVTHEWRNGAWAAVTTEPLSADYSFNGDDTLVITGLTGSNSAFNGTWRRQ